MARDSQITSMDQSMKRLQERMDMPPPNEQWAFIQQLTNRIENRDKDVIVLRRKYERAKAIMASHGINSNDVSGGMSILG